MNSPRNLILFWTLVSASLFLSSFVTTEDILSKIIASFTSWAKSNPQEKIHIHTDNDQYAIGDTIWFKAYVVQSPDNKLSNLSEGLNVELINDKDETVKSIKVHVDSGLAVGDFELDTHNDPGEYTIRAYTRWMRNFSEEFFFERKILVENPDDDGSFATINYNLGKTAGSQTNSIATVSIYDRQNKPLVNKKAELSVLVAQKLITTQSGITDNEGNLHVDLENFRRLQGEEAYVKATVYDVAGDAKTVDIPIKKFDSNPNFFFFPEGGNLAYGHSSKVAFKCVGLDGRGVPVAGVIEENRTKVASFSSDYTGIGTFTFKPERGKSYSAKITFAGTEKVVDLPRVEERSHSLSAQQNKDSVEILIKKTPEDKNSLKKLVLIGQSGGNIIFSSVLNLVTSEMFIRLAKSKIPEGICQFVLLGEGGEVMNERLIFVTKDESTIVDVKTSKPVYNKKDDITLLIGRDDLARTIFHCSVAINKISSPKHKEMIPGGQMINANFLFRSALGSQVENLEHYLSNATSGYEKLLDNLLLTLTDKRYNWKKILENQELKHKYNVEKEKTSLSGQIIGAGNRPIPNAKLSLLSLNGGILEWSKSDLSGRFIFDSLLLFEGSKFLIHARSKDETRLRILMDGPNVPAGVSEIKRTDILKKQKYYFTNSSNKLIGDENSGSRTGRKLQEVKIKARKIDDKGFTPQGMVKIPEGHADQTLYSDKLTCQMLYLCLQGRFPGIIFVTRGFVRNYPAYYDRELRSYRPMNVYLDGRKLLDDEISQLFDGNSIDPKDIGKVELVRTNLALLTMLGEPSILIVTKKGYSIRQNYSLNSIEYYAKGFYNPNTFNAQHVEVSSKAVGSGSRSTTVYWNPKVSVDNRANKQLLIGKLRSAGTYKVVIEGMDSDGRISQTVTTFKVQ